MPDVSLLMIWPVSDGNTMFSYHFKWKNQGFIIFMGSDPEAADAAADGAADTHAESANNQRYVIITGDSAKVPTEASTFAKLIRMIYKGDVFPLLGEKGDFYSIQIEGQTGYVHKGMSAVK